MTTDSEPTVACPELEELAAFVDGKLSGAERDAVVEHLASCEACYEVYAETLRIQEDLGPRAVPAADEDEEGPEPAPVVPHPRSFGWAWRAGVALAAAVLLAVGLLWFLSRPKLVPVADLARFIEPGSSSLLEGEDWATHDWPRFRGVAPRLGQTDRDSAIRAFRLGVHAVDLEASVRLGDSDGAEAQTFQIESLLGDLVFSQPYVLLCRELRDRINAGASREEILKSAFGLMDELTQVEDPPVDELYFSFGKWVEKSRVLALTGDPRYFSESEFDRFLRRFESAELGKEVSRRVREVGKLAASEPVPLEDLIGPLDEIIKLEGVR